MDAVVPLPPIVNLSVAVVAEAARLSRLEPVDLMVRSRKRERAYPRFAACWALNRHDRSKYSTPRLARLVGFKDHTSVVYALRKAEKLRAENPEFRELSDKLLAFADALRVWPREAA